MLARSTIISSNALTPKSTQREGVCAMFATGIKNQSIQLKCAYKCKALIQAHMLKRNKSKYTKRIRFGAGIENNWPCMCLRNTHFFI